MTCAVGFPQPARRDRQHRILAEPQDSVTTTGAATAAQVKSKCSSGPPRPPRVIGPSKDPEETWRRLKAVRSALDPDGGFAANHAIPSP